MLRFSLVRRGLAVAIATILLPLSACGTDDSGIKLVLAVETSEGDPLADMLIAFADEVEAELGDEVEIQLQTGGAIGDEEAVLQALRGGAVDVAAVSGSVANVAPIFNIMEMPFLFTDRVRVSEFLDGPFGQEMSDSLIDEIGVRVLSFGENGFRHITNNEHPIQTPADLDGLRIRVPGSPARVSLFEALGAVPTQIDIGEAYLALDQGVLDGQENPLKVIDAFSFYEKQAYLSLTAHIYSPVYLTVNEDTWNDLPSDVQEALERAAAAASQHSRDLGEQADASLVDEFTDYGVEVNEADTEAFVDAVGGVREQIAADIPGDFAERVLAEYGS